MAFNHYLAERLRVQLKQKGVSFEEKKMMGGLCFMVNYKMCVGIVKEELMVRINPEMDKKALAMKGVREMDFTGKPMKGYVFVSQLSLDLDTELDFWINLALEFNPLAKSSKKKQA